MLQRLPSQVFAFLILPLIPLFSGCVGAVMAPPESAAVESNDSEISVSFLVPDNSLLVYAQIYVDSERPTLEQDACLGQFGHMVATVNPIHPGLNRVPLVNSFDPSTSVFWWAVVAFYDEFNRCVGSVPAQIFILPNQSTFSGLTLSFHQGQSHGAVRVFASVNPAMASPAVKGISAIRVCARQAVNAPPGYDAPSTRCWDQSFQMPNASTRYTYTVTATDYPSTQVNLSALAVFKKEDGTESLRTLATSTGFYARDSVSPTAPTSASFTWASLRAELDIGFGAADPTVFDDYQFIDAFAYDSQTFTPPTSCTSAGSVFSDGSITHLGFSIWQSAHHKVTLQLASELRKSLYWNRISPTADSVLMCISDMVGNTTLYTVTPNFNFQPATILGRVTADKGNQNPSLQLTWDFNHEEVVGMRVRTNILGHTPMELCTHDQVMGADGHPVNVITILEIHHSDNPEDPKLFNSTYELPTDQVSKDSMMDNGVIMCLHGVSMSATFIRGK